MQIKERAVGGKGREEERRKERERRKEKTGDWGCQRPSRVRKHPGHTETMTSPRPGLKKTQVASSLRNVGLPKIFLRCIWITQNRPSCYQVALCDVCCSRWLYYSRTLVDCLIACLHWVKLDWSLFFVLDWFLFCWLPSWGGTFFSSLIKIASNVENFKFLRLILCVSCAVYPQTLLNCTS